MQDELIQLTKLIKEHLPSIEKCGAIDPQQLRETPLKDLGKVLKQWHAWLSAYVIPAQAVINDGTTVKKLTELLQEWSEIEDRELALSKHKPLRKCLGDVATGTETDWPRLKATEAWIDEMQKVGLPEPWFDGLLALDDEATWAQVIQVISQGAEAWQEILVTFQGFDGHLTEATKWLKSHITPELTKKVEALVHESDFLPRWSQFCRLRNRGDDLGVSPYFRAWEDGHVEHNQLAAMFQLVEYRRMVATEIQLNPVLREFVAEPHEQLRANFRKLDQELTLLNQQEIAANIGSRKMPEGNGYGPRGSHTEGALVRHQVGLKKKQLPLRLLMSRALEAVQTLKPCFMMSPLTVAQFLAPGLTKIDVLLMDEASQILPEDALGAIARCRQVVVVGDPKQLPPTSFFRVSSDDDGDEDEETMVEASESILETCDVAFSRTRRLLWHYRSLHESLIAFSNSEFYGNLQVFPSPVRDSTIYGIRWHKVDGIYLDNRNPIEAAAVVDGIADQLRSDPTKSIGVITFNLKQKELIEDLLAKRGRSDPLLSELIERAENHEEPLIIRNLESIQGEQRDIIFISVNFAPQILGAGMAQRFGPVNSSTGWRRLNVMFSRAKERMEIFSSITSDHIAAEPNAKTGAAYLKRFLRYAENGRLETITPFGEREMDSDFERSVAEHVRALGYDVEAQIGVSGFWIDLGVFPPGRRDRFCLGIECDGASYHSSRVARDRDRIREDVLSGRGWKLHRIWSTDWFQDRTAALRKLAIALKASHG